MTSSSPSRDEDSFRKTAMSRREDIVSCIDVTIMNRSAYSTLPSSYSKTFPAFRAGAAVTHTASLGGKRFIDFLEPHACVSAFVQQHGSECAPSRIEHRLRLSSLRQGGGILSITVHPYSIPTNHPKTRSKTSRNARRGMHAALRASLSLAGLKAGVSRGEI